VRQRDVMRSPTPTQMPESTTRTGWHDAPPSPQPRTWTRYQSWLQARPLDRLVVLLGLLLAVAAIYWPSSLALDGFWTDTVDHTYTHGYLVLLTSLWLVSRDRARLAAVPVRPVAAAWLVVVVLSAAWLWLWGAAIQDAQLLLLPLLLLAAVVATLGFPIARVLSFPIGFLYFAMPVWSDINGILQDSSVRVSGLLIWITGIPGYLEGNLVQLPAGTLEIAEGCSGLHFLIVGVTLAALYGELSQHPLRRRVLWVVSMGALALVTNWLRIFVIIAVAYLTDMHTFLVAHHYWFGWVLFVVAFMAFLWLAGRLSTAGELAPPSEESPHDQPPAPSRVALGRLAVTLACLGLLPALAYGSQLLWPEKHTGVAINWPSVSHGWQGPRPDVASEWAPEFAGATAESLRRYVDDRGEAIEVFVAAYRNQTQHGKLLGYFNSLLGSSQRLHALSERIVSSPTGSWRQTTVVDGYGARSLVWSRYLVGERRFVRPRVSQLWYGIAAFTSRPVSAIIALRAGCVPDCSHAQARLAAATGLQPNVRPTLRARGRSAP
jgi:exosortase A